MRLTIVLRCFLALRVFLDLLAIPFVIIAAYSLKFKWGWFFHNIVGVSYGEIYEHAQIEPYLKGMLILGLLWVIAFYFVGMYKPVKGVFPELDVSIKVMKGLLLGVFQVLVVATVYPIIPISKYVLFYSFCIGTIVLSVGRIIILKLEAACIHHYGLAKPTLIIGSSFMGQDVAEKILQFPHLKMAYIGHIGKKKSKQLHFHLRDRYNYLGGIDSVFKQCETYNIQTVFITEKDLSKQYVSSVISFCESHGIELKIVAHMMVLTPLSYGEALDGIPFMSIERQGWQVYPLVKRFFDFITAVLILVVVSPLMLILAILMKFSSPSFSVLYRQTRVGYHGRVFRIIKLRSMVPHAERHTGPKMVAQKGENRYTHMGQFLRRWSLDEIPQLWNVIKGDMSLVGPRPERPYFVKKFSKQNPYYKLRHQVRGGVTGWAQINGRSYLTDKPNHKLNYDMYYVKNASFLLDLKILWRTLFVIFKQEEVY